MNAEKLAHCSNPNHLEAISSDEEELEVPVLSILLRFLTYPIQKHSIQHLFQLHHPTFSIPLYIGATQTYDFPTLPVLGTGWAASTYALGLGGEVPHGLFSVVFS